MRPECEGCQRTECASCLNGAWGLRLAHEMVKAKMLEIKKRGLEIPRP